MSRKIISIFTLLLFLAMLLDPMLPYATQAQLNTSVSSTAEKPDLTSEASSDKISLDLKGMDIVEVIKKSWRCSLKRKVMESDIVEEVEPFADLL